MLNNTTIVILTKNEEKNLEILLGFLNDYKIKILIVDSGSTDNTLEICKKYEVEVLFNRFKDFSSQRNYALNVVKTDWVLFLDADELLSKDLINWLFNYFDENNKDFSAYRFIRKTKAFGRNLKYTWRDTVVRLINKNKCKYDQNLLVHEKIITKGKIVKVKKGFILHNTYNNFEQYLKKMNLYITLEAKQKSKKNISILKIIFYSIAVFFDRLLLKKWILDGIVGIHAAFTASTVKFLSLSLAKSLKDNGNIYK